MGEVAVEAEAGDGAPGRDRRIVGRDAHGDVHGGERLEGAEDAVDGNGTAGAMGVEGAVDMHGHGGKIVAGEIGEPEADDVGGGAGAEDRTGTHPPGDGIEPAGEEEFFGRRRVAAGEVEGEVAIERAPGRLEIEEGSVLVEEYAAHAGNRPDRPLPPTALTAH